MSTNPFTTMMLTFSPNRFYGRDSEIISLLQILTANEPTSQAIYGVRTLGKTTLLRFLRDPNGAQARFEAYMHPDFSPEGRRRLMFIYVNYHSFQAGENIHEYLLRELEEALMDHEILIRVPRYDVGNADDIPGILQRITRELRSEDIRPVFLMDDFDSALANLKSDDDGLLRVLSEYAVLVIITEAPISELQPQIGDDSPLLGILRALAIQLISESSARQLITEPIEDVGESIGKAECDFLIEIAGRHPFFLVAASELYFNMRQEYPEIRHQIDTPETATLKKRFLLRLSQLPHVNKALSLIWNRLNDLEREVLVIIAVNRRFEAHSGHEQVAERLENKALVVFNLARGSYTLFSDLFQIFIEQNTKKTGPLPQIKVAEEAAEDRLTPIDRALLNYLLDHVDRTCTFEELLAEVWSDRDTGDRSKRALEAAVYRLRNSRAIPAGFEIRNVRGKGYKMVRESA